MRKRRIYLSGKQRVFQFPGTNVTEGLVGVLESWIDGLYEKDREELRRLEADAGRAGGGYSDWNKGLAALAELSLRKLEERRGEIPEAADSRGGRPRLPKQKFKWILSCWANKDRRHLILDWQAMCGAETDGMAMLVWMDMMAADGSFGPRAPRLPNVCTFDLDRRAEAMREELRVQSELASARLV